MSKSPYRCYASGMMEESPNTVVQHSG